MALATFVAAVLCALVAFSVIGESGVWLSLAAAAFSLPVGVVVVTYFYRSGTSVESIVVGTGLRVLLTALMAGAGAFKIEELRGPVFLLALAAIYLANLGVETWFAFRKSLESRRIGTPG